MFTLIQITKINQLLLVTYQTPPEIRSVFVDSFLSYAAGRQTHKQIKAKINDKIIRSFANATELI